MAAMVVRMPTASSVLKINDYVSQAAILTDDIKAGRGYFLVSVPILVRYFGQIVCCRPFVAAYIVTRNRLIKLNLN